MRHQFGIHLYPTNSCGRLVSWYLSMYCLCRNHKPLPLALFWLRRVWEQEGGEQRSQKRWCTSHFWKPWKLFYRTGISSLRYIYMCVHGVCVVAHNSSDMFQSLCLPHCVCVNLAYLIALIYLQPCAIASLASTGYRPLVNTLVSSTVARVTIV